MHSAHPFTPRSDLCERINPRLKIIAFVGPSNTGKTTLIQELYNCDARLRRMISITTRQPRDSDPPGEYEYVSMSTFREREENNVFLWTTEVHENRYGTQRRNIEEALQSQWPTVMHLEPRCVPPLLEVAGPAVCLIFVGSLRHELEHRIRHRDPGKPDKYYADRINSCLEWESEARASKFPYHFIYNLQGHLPETIAALLRLLCTQ